MNFLSPFCLKMREKWTFITVTVFTHTKGLTIKPMPLVMTLVTLCLLRRWTAKRSLAFRHVANTFLSHVRMVAVCFLERAMCITYPPTPKFKKHVKIVFEGEDLVLTDFKAPVNDTN